MLGLAMFGWYSFQAEDCNWKPLKCWMWWYVWELVDPSWVLSSMMWDVLWSSDCEMSLSTSRQRGPLKLLSIENNRDVNKLELESYIYIYNYIYTYFCNGAENTKWKHSWRNVISRCETVDACLNIVLRCVEPIRHVNLWQKGWVESYRNHFFFAWSTLHVHGILPSLQQT